MVMLHITTAQTEADLTGILLLQQANLGRNLTPQEAATQGFVTVEHSLNELEKLNLTEKHIVAKEAEKVVGYVLAMTPHSKTQIPVLIPMFEIFDHITYQNNIVSTYRYMVVGQVCIAKSHRGTGLFYACYEAFRRQYAGKYRFAITEIAANNHRSLKAHSRMGFEAVHTYTAPNGVEWVVVVWDWQQNKDKG